MLRTRRVRPPRVAKESSARPLAGYEFPRLAREACDGADDIERSPRAPQRRPGSHIVRGLVASALDLDCVRRHAVPGDTVGAPLPPPLTLVNISIPLLRPRTPRFQTCVPALFTRISRAREAATVSAAFATSECAAIAARPFDSSGSAVFVEYDLRLSAEPIDAGKRLDHLLHERLPEFSRSRIQAWIRDGRPAV